jgi:hypothetical protein
MPTGDLIQLAARREPLSGDANALGKPLRQICVIKLVALLGLYTKEARSDDGDHEPLLKVLKELIPV